MDPCLLKQIRTTRSVSKRNLISNLGRVLVEAAGGTLTVRRARDGLSAVLRRAREGAPQVIGGAEEGVVVISVRDLATLIDAAMEPTLSEALERSGFEPYRGKRIVVGERRNRESLKRRGDTPPIPGG